MNEKQIIDILDQVSDENFIKIIRNYKNRIKKIEKKEKFKAVEQKFKEKEIQCPDCNSFLCIKNDSKDSKQRYKCKSCKITFHHLKNIIFTEAIYLVTNEIY